MTNYITSLKAKLAEHKKQSRLGPNRRTRAARASMAADCEYLIAVEQVRREKLVNTQIELELQAE